MADGTIVTPGLTESCAATCCRSTPSALSLTSERAALIRQAFRLEWMTIAWMVVEGVVALGAGLAAASLTLTAFGLDSAIELASAGVLIWRLNVELRHGQGFSDRAERTVSRIGAVLLFHACGLHRRRSRLEPAVDPTRRSLFASAPCWQCQP